MTEPTLLDTSVIAGANLAPYAAVATVAWLRRRGLTHSSRQSLLWGVTAMVVVMMATQAVDPTLDLHDIRWLGYAVVFLVGGAVTWISFGFFWLAWIFWTGRIANKAQNAGVPLAMATGGICLALVIWLYPLSATSIDPGILVAVIAVVLLSLTILTMAVAITDRPPWFLVGRTVDLTVQPDRVYTQPLWFDLVLASLLIAAMFGILIPLQAATHYNAWQMRFVMLPIIFILGCLVGIIKYFTFPIWVRRNRRNLQ